MNNNNSPQHNSPFASNMRKPGHQNYPADLLKFNAWATPVNNFETAVNIILQKKLVLGEPAVVPFKFMHSDGVETLELALGIGSADVNHPFIKSSITNDIINEAIIAGVDENGDPVYKTLAEILDEFITKDEAQQVINQGVLDAVRDETIINNIADAVSETGVLQEIINRELKWRPLSELVSRI